MNLRTRALAATVLLLALTAVTATGSPASAQVTVTASAPAQTPVGVAVTAKVKVTGTSAGEAQLQYRKGSSWVKVDRTIRLTSGAGSATVNPPQGSRTYRFVVGSVASNTFVVKAVPVTVKASVAKASLTPGASTVATVSLSTKLTGVAKLQYLVGSRWVTDGRTIPITNGVGTTTLKPPASRSYRFTVGKAVSSTVKVAVAVKVAASAPSTTTPGKAVRASFVVTGATSGTATLQYKKGTSWVKVARTIKFSGGKGSTTVNPPSARSYRFVVNGAASAPFTVTPKAMTVKATVAKATVAPGGSTEATITVTPAVTTTAKLQYLSGSTWVTDKRVIAITNGVGKTTLKPPTTKRSYRFVVGSAVSGSVAVAASGVPTTFTVKGAGWGHGVGMSQYGAFGMALDGYGAGDILKHYYAGTKVQTVSTAGAKDLRVQVFGSGTDNTTSVNLVVRSPGADSVADGQWRLRFYSNSATDTPLQTWTGINNEDLMIKRSGTRTTVTRENGTTYGADYVAFHWEATSYYQTTSKEDPYVELLNREGGTLQTHGQYRHGRMIIKVINNRITVVNSLDLNTEYLNGVAEMPSSWATEALKAQAITARGYALDMFRAGIKKDCGCHLYDDPRSQNFSGWKKENEGTNATYGKRWVAAVTATSSNAGGSGKVLTHGAGGVGNIARTYYFSSSGGQTEHSENVWSSKVSYLRSTSDPWSLAAAVKNPNASWTATLTQAQAAKAFNLTNVVKITVSQRTSSASTAAAYKVTATSSTGATSTITGTDNVRIKLGLKSPWIRSIAGS